MHRTALISCTHFGSRVAPWPSMKFDGVVYKPSPTQTRLNKIFALFMNEVAETADTVIMLGDTIQGSNRKESGAGTMVPEIDYQIEAAITILDPLRGKQLFGVMSTEYHDSIDTSVDRRVVEALGGRFMGLVGNVKIGGLGFNFAHGGGARPKYIASKAQMMCEEFDSAEGADRLNFHTDVIVRGHWHTFAHYQGENRHCIFVPSWQDWYDWTPLSNNYAANHSKLGGVFVDHENGEISVVKRLWNRVLVRQVA